MVADITTAGAVRGYAQYDEEKLAQAMKGGASAPVPRLLGAGYIAFTVDQGEHSDRYQGIVELQGATLAECAHHYFRQSEQLQAGIKVAVERRQDTAGRSLWRAGGLMLQRLPAEGGSVEPAQLEEQEDGWRRAMILMSSSTNAELLDPALAPSELLFRLFHEDGVHVWQPNALAARCRCSKERITRILRAMPAEDLHDMRLDDGRIEVTCEFCNERYDFGDDEVAALAPEA
jgi:molecular chaperone Hsp33